MLVRVPQTPFGSRGAAAYRASTALKVSQWTVSAAQTGSARDLSYAAVRESAGRVEYRFVSPARTRSGAAPSGARIERM